VRKFSSSSHPHLRWAGDHDCGALRAVCSRNAFAVLAAGSAYEWGGSNGTDVPAIGLRPERPAEDKPSERSKARKKPEADRAETKGGAGTGDSTTAQSETPSSGGTGGASPAPAPAPAPAGDDDDDGDGGDDDGDDDGGDDDGDDDGGDD
jgi:hypothetical protein